VEPRCPYCGSTRLVTTPEGRLVCGRCGTVIQESILINYKTKIKEEKINKRKSRILKIHIKIRPIFPRANSAPYPDLDPLDRIAFETLKANKNLSLGRKPSTIAALARASRLMAEGHTLRSAIREAARRYNVSERTLLILARKHRRAVATAVERVVEAWSKSTRRGDQS